MHMQLGVSSYCLVGRPLDESLDILSGFADLIEVMDEGAHFITDPAVLERYTGCDEGVSYAFHWKN